MDWTGSSTTAVDLGSEPLEGLQPHPCPWSSSSSDGSGNQRPASVQSILEDEDDMIAVKTEVEAGSHVNRRPRGDQPAWDYLDGKGGGGGEA